METRNHMLERTRQLGMPYGTARNKLQKALMFKMMQLTSQDDCFRCGCKISTQEELSIEHKVAWLHDPNAVELFFDLDNVAFSHLDCNTVSRRTNLGKKIVKVGKSGFRGVEINTSRVDRPTQPKFRARYNNATIGFGDDPRNLAILYDSHVVKIEGKLAVTNKSLGLLQY